MKAKSDQPFLPLQMRKARREAGLSQNELSEKMDIHRNTIIRWESKVSVPTVVQAEALAQALDKPVEFFYTAAEPVKVTPKMSSDWTRKTSLARLQQLTPEAILRVCRALRINTAEIAQRIGVPHSLVKDWSLGRASPEMDDLNLLRAAYGEEFDPTPSLARSSNSSMAQRMDRMEKLLFKIYAALKKANLVDE